MDRMYFYLMIIVMLLVSLWNDLACSQTLDWEEKEVIAVVGEVSGEILESAQQLNALPDKSTARILINSPGGDVLVGSIFIQAMHVVKARGGKIECVVANLAASMAMHILAHCDTRYILEGGYLLFHEASVTLRSGRVNISTAKRVIEMLYIISIDLENYLIKQLGADPVLFKKHNEEETLWTSGAFSRTFPKFGLKSIQDVRLPKKLQKYLFSMQ